MSITPADPATVYNERLKARVVVLNATAVGLGLIGVREAVSGEPWFLIGIVPAVALHRFAHYLVGTVRREP